MTHKDAPQSRPHYGALNLPPFVDGTQGLIALPSPKRIVVAMPVTGDVLLAMGTGAESYRVSAKPGDWHIAYEGDSNHHRGVEYSTSLGPDQTHQQLGEADPNRDPRAAFLRGYWTTFGLNSTIVELQRIANVLVVGQIAEEAHDHRMRITGDWFTLQMGMFLLSYPERRDVLWLTTEGNMHFEYAALHAANPNGTVGELLRTF